MLRVGHHESENARVGMFATLKHAYQRGATAAQIAFGDMTHYMTLRDPYGPVDSDGIRQIVATGEFSLVVHGKYVYNFAAPPQSDAASTARQSLQRELFHANELGGLDVVIHQGKNVGRFEQSNQQALRNYVVNLQSVLEYVKRAGLTSKILLENSARQGSEVGWSLEDMVWIWDRFSDDDRLHLGWCVDTCHLHAAGEVNMSDPDQVHLWLERFDESIGAVHLRVVHLNGSQHMFGERKDRHAGLLASESTIHEAGLTAFVQWIKVLRVPPLVIIETRGTVREDEISFVHAQ